MPSSPVANMVLLASMVVIGVGVAGGLALGIYMYFANKLLVGILGGVAIIGLGFVLSLVIKGVAEMVNNSQKNAYYLSKLVKMVEDEE